MRREVGETSRVASLKLEPRTKKHITRCDEVVEIGICQRF
jgi:hypothetical protein